MAYSDGGGKAPAAVNPIYGADRVMRLMIGISRKMAAGLEAVPASIGGEPGCVLMKQDRPHSFLTLDIAGDGLVRGVYIVTNPEKLRSFAPALR